MGSNANHHRITYLGNGGREIAEYTSYTHRVRVCEDEIPGALPTAYNISVECTCGLVTKPKRTNPRTRHQIVDSAVAFVLEHADKTGREEWARRHPGVPCSY